MKQTEKLYIGDIIFTSYDPAEELKIPQMVFVSENGDDANDGSSIQKAVKTVGRAYEIAAECKNITFLVDGSVTQGEAALEYPELTVVFASALNGKEAEITGGFTAVSNAVFENVGISGGLEDDGFELEFADSFTEADTIIIKSGKIQLIGGTADRIIITGENTEKSINISVDGTEINRLEFSGTSGVVTVGYYSGTINSVIAGSGAVTEHLQLLVGSGMTKPSGFDEVNVTGQKLTIAPPLMRASTGEYFKVNGTDSFGVFETFSGRTLNFGYGLTSYICYAYSSDGRKVYYSNSDTGYTLTLPESGEYQLYIAGEADYTAASGKNIKGCSTSMLKLPAGATGWTDDNNGAISAVMSAESQLYINDGYVLNVYADGQVFDIASLEHAQPEGRVFLGWSLDESGNNYPTDNEITLNSGDKLYAQFAESKFDIIGAQIRLTGEQGLRFITETNDSFINEVLSSADYGSVVFVTKYLGGDELLLDTEYSYGNKTYASKSVKAEKLFSYDENTGTIQYTVCIIDILPENYIREYTVRPYARYTDKNGNSRVYYGDQYSTGVFAVANYALRTDDSLSAEDKEVFEEINSIGLAAKEAPIAYTSGSSSSTEEDYRHGKVIYTTESGVKVCEIHVPAKGTASSGAEIAVVTDTHINVVDDNDMYDAEVQYTNQTRAWCRGGATVPGTEKAIKFASMYDQMVVTGDIIDYLSLGALETVKRIAFDPYPEGMYVLGGHDVTKNMETGYADQLSLEQRQEILRQYWPNDMFYTSRVINGSVICIQLDNGCSQYWDSQVALIENDLNTARENGYTVLIFQHEPLGTGNPEDTAVPSLCPDADSAKVTYNFYGSAHIGGNGKNDTAASKAVYELITNNGDIIGGIFAGHRHYRYYTEILAKTADGEDCVIPQYVLRSCAYETNGFVTKIVFGQE